MIRWISDLFESVRPPRPREVFFPSKKLNRRLVFWYAGRVVTKDSIIEPLQRLQDIDRMRRQRNSFTFICNHLSYADSHVIEVLLIRNGFGKLADHLIHIAGQKTFEISRRMLTRSLNTVRVYQPKAKVEKAIKKKMNARALKWAAHLKRKGYSLLVFPEGTRTRQQTQFNIHAANPKTTIYFRDSYVVPIALMGSEELMPVGRMIPKPATVRIRVGEPVEHATVEHDLRMQYSDLNETDLRKVIMRSYMNRIHDLLDPPYRLAMS